MASRGLVTVVAFTLVYLVVAENAHTKSDRIEFKKSLGKNCGSSYSLTCFKLDAASWVDRLSANDDISVLPGVSLVREKNSVKAENDDIVADLAREFPDDPNARLDAFLLKKIAGFLDNHSVKLNLWKAVQTNNEGTARKGGGGGGYGGGGGGGKKGGGGGGGMGMVLAMGAMMKGMMMSMALAGVAAMAGKALMASLAALLLAAVASLKGKDGGGGHSTYEVISKPVYTSSHSHSTSHEGGGWDGYGHGRSLDNSPLPIALQPGYQPPQ